jgi:hypothetical protein
VIRGENKSWVITSECRHGKQPHMASASEELTLKNGRVRNPSVEKYLDFLEITCLFLSLLVRYQ